MPKNRVFKPASSLRLPLQHCLTDATRMAREAGFNLQLHVESHLLRWYYIPDCPDEDGRALIRELLEQMDLVLAGKVKAVRVSYGEWLVMRFEFAAQHRRRSMPTILTLQARLGLHCTFRPGFTRAIQFSGRKLSFPGTAKRAPPAATLDYSGPTTYRQVQSINASGERLMLASKYERIRELENVPAPLAALW